MGDPAAVRTGVASLRGMGTRDRQLVSRLSLGQGEVGAMSEPSRRERYLKALEIAERHGNRFMAANIRAELRKLDAEPTTTQETP
jgi:hypothetical protein